MISHKMAKRIVDHLEAVQIQKQKGEALLGAFAASRMVSARLSTNRRRFGNPVTVSKALLAVISVNEPTMRLVAPSADRMIAPRVSTHR